MSDNFDDLTVFARTDTVDGELKVVEYPVFALHIRNRAQPFSWYTQVEFGDKPVVPDFSSLCETVTLSVTLQGVVHVKATYTVVPFTLAQILNDLRKKDEQGFPTSEPMDIADVPLATVNRVAELATALAQSKLDAFAQLRNYDSINSVCGYRGSAVVKFAGEADQAFVLRDATWNALYTYLGEVTTKAKPVPLTVEEIEAILPAMSWE